MIQNREILGELDGNLRRELRWELDSELDREMLNLYDREIIYTGD